MWVLQRSGEKKTVPERPVKCQGLYASSAKALTVFPISLLVLAFITIIPPFDTPNPTVIKRECACLLRESKKKRVPMWKKKIVEEVTMLCSGLC